MELVEESPWTEADREAVIADLGREPRGVAGVAARCVCGKPLVVTTLPRLPDGTPFPTVFYLTDRTLTAACSRLEAEHFMEEMTTLLEENEELRAAHALAHDDYLRRRTEVGEAAGIGEVVEISGISAGGLPARVKCLHALVGHSLAAGPGINPIGDLALVEISRRGQWSSESCSCA